MPKTTDISKLPDVIAWRAASRAVEKAWKAVEDAAASAAPIPQGRSPAAELETMRQRLELIPLEIALEEARLVLSRATVKASVAVDRAEFANGDELAVRGSIAGLRDAYLALLEKEERLKEELAAVAGELDQQRTAAENAWAELAERRRAEDLPRPVEIPVPTFDGFSGRTPPKEMVRRFEATMNDSRLDERNHPCVLGIGKLRNEERDLLIAIGKREREAKERAKAEANHVSYEERQRQSAERDRERWAAHLAEKQAEEEKLVAEGRGALGGR